MDPDLNPDSAFITQNSFIMNDTMDTQAAAECASNLMDLWDDDLNPPPAKRTRSTGNVYEPETSDVSDGELMSTCEEMEVEFGRFGSKPLDDKEVSARSKRR